jgi:hypothetical protein
MMVGSLSMSESPSYNRDKVLLSLERAVVLGPDQWHFRGGCRADGLVTSWMTS